MIGAIINGIFNLVVSMFEALMSPFINVIVALFPAVNTYFGYINIFLSYCTSYLGFFLDILFIPKQALVLLFDYYLIIYSIYISSLAIRFALNVYNKFKI